MKWFRIQDILDKGLYPSDFDVDLVSSYDIFYIVFLIIDAGLDTDDNCFTIVEYLLAKDIDAL